MQTQQERYHAWLTQLQQARSGGGARQIMLDLPNVSGLTISWANLFMHTAPI
jgi:hypothetical protein